MMFWDQPTESRAGVWTKCRSKYRILRAQ